ncbi:MAG: Crp/Fnr family transcriptional regulator [Bacteroidales bacterium]|jgi:CRP-like cAMP-binding protein|nr:Crp/Fnr family transcriptional regulator [Bacteroidales bacterium]MCR5362536.1 Crp/Fnr family transcriptional regulator [Bacteroidales bacterium]
MTESEIASGLREIWNYLSEPQQKALIDNAIGLNFDKGDYIYHDEEESIYLYCMVSGHAKLEKSGVGGRSQIMRMFQPGDIFGYRSFFANQEHTTEAVAIENVQVACIPMTLIERFCLVNPDLAMYFLRNLAVDLGKSDLRTLDLTQKHIRGRLAGSLVFLIDKYGMEPDGRTLNISLSREDLASLSNMTTSNAIRTLASFSDEGIISVDGRRITVLDASKLKHVNAQG